MMSTARRSAALASRAVGPASLFGAGYGLCWAQNREESAPQLAAAALLRGWTGASGAVRCLAKSVPADLAWPREQLAKAELKELRVLADAVDGCCEKGWDSTVLHAAALERLCLLAKEDPNGLAIQGLGTNTSTSSFHQLLKAIDRSISKMGPGSRGDQVPRVAAALRSLIEAHGGQWGKDATPDGVVALAHISLVASTWLAESLHSRKLGSKPYPLSLEDEQSAIKDLTYVWQSLQRLPSGQRLGAGKLSESQEVYKDLKLRFSTLQAWQQPPSQEMLRPKEEALPAKLRASIAGAMAGRGLGWFSSGGMPAPAPAPAPAPTPAPAPAPPPPDAAAAGPPAATEFEEAKEEAKEEAAAAVDVEAPAPAKEIAPPPEAVKQEKDSTKSWQRVAIELAAAGVLVVAGVVMLSDDGFGILQSVRLVPTQPGRNQLRSEVLRRGVQAEDLAAREALTNFEREGVLVAGPNDFGKMADSFVEVPDV